MNPILKRLLKLVSDLLVLAVVIFAMLFHGVQLFGYTPYTVLSGSMERVYPTGSLIYVDEVDTDELKVGDVITFRMDGGTVATHRIVELVPDENGADVVRFRTKGDENNIHDGDPVDPSRVIGSPVFCIPRLGYFATYIMTPPGKYVAFAVAAGLILVEIIISIALDDKGKKK